ncbi:hypothetical protein PHSC3_001390 [Chlamydiales bacterium STE3]|nr:hypothetical protein PHSC3_001390 [Chlamydiales bacterium STE3]
MKYSHITGFEKHLLAAAPQNLSPLYVILAKEENERKLAVSKVKNIFEENATASWQSYDATESAEQEIFNDLDTFSFLQPVKAIHIGDFHHFKKPVLERLEKYFASPPRGVYLILSGSDLKAHTHFYKRAEKCGVILEMVDEKPWEKEKNVQEWLVQEAAKLGKRMAPQAVQLLIKAVGNNVFHLLSELNKLFCFAGERGEITVEDIRAIACYTHQENSWQLGDALFKRNGALAFKISRGILAQEVPFFVLLRQIRTQFQTALHVASLSSSSEVKEDFPQLKESSIERHRAHVQDYGYSKLPEALKTINQVEWMAKNGMDRYDLLSDFLIFKLVTL